MTVKVPNQGIHSEHLPISVFRLRADVVQSIVIGEYSNQVVIEGGAPSCGGAVKERVFQFFELNEFIVLRVRQVLDEIPARHNHLAVIGPQQSFLNGESCYFIDMGAEIFGNRRTGIARLQRLLFVRFEFLPEFEHINTAIVNDLALEVRTFIGVDKLCAVGEVNRHRSSSIHTEHNSV